MISALKSFDRVTAAGLLARAALALHDDANPEARAKISDENVVRDAVLTELRTRLGLKPDDFESNSVEALSDLLDEEADKIVEEADENAALDRLSREGALPSDLFRLELVPNIKDFFGKYYPEEYKLIVATVKNPTLEQHYRQAHDNGPYMVSLFARFYPNIYPHRSFYMIVAGQRDGTELRVQQAWRIYPSAVDLSGMTDLMDMLKRFADKYGATMKSKELSGKFILTENFEQSGEHTFVMEHDHDHDVMMSVFTQDVHSESSHEHRHSSLIVCIDLELYRRLLKSRTHYHDLKRVRENMFTQSSQQPTYFVGPIRK